MSTVAISQWLCDTIMAISLRISARNIDNLRPTHGVSIKRAVITFRVGTREQHYTSIHTLSILTRQAGAESPMWTATSTSISSIMRHP